jgi:hypothetical protein
VGSTIASVSVVSQKHFSYVGHIVDKSRVESLNVADATRRNLKASSKHIAGWFRFSDGQQPASFYSCFGKLRDTHLGL